MFTILLFLPILKGSFVATARNYERNKCLHTCVHTVSTTNECARLTCTMTDWLTDRLGEKERDEAERVKKDTLLLSSSTQQLVLSSLSLRFDQSFGFFFLFVSLSLSPQLHYIVSSTWNQQWRRKQISNLFVMFPKVTWSVSLIAFILSFFLVASTNLFSFLPNFVSVTS